MPLRCRLFGHSRYLVSKPPKVCFTFHSSVRSDECLCAMNIASIGRGLTHQSPFPLPTTFVFTSQGYAPLLKSWENFYVRRLYHRIQVRALRSSYTLDSCACSLSAGPI